jgi:hypothetical protein
MARLHGAAYSTSTNTVHALAWRRWGEFRKGHDLYLSQENTVEQRRSLVKFSLHLINELGATEGVMQSTQSGLSDYFARNMSNTVSLYSDPVIQHAFKAARVLAAKVNVTRRMPRILPLTVELLNSSDGMVTEAREDDILMTRLAVRFGTNVGSRAGETCMADSTYHELRAEGVFFLFDTGPPVVSTNISVEESRLPQCAKFVWTSSKRGPKEKYLRGIDAPEIQRLISDLMDWSRCPLRLGCDPFFTSYRRGRRKQLTTHMIRDFIKEIAVSNGLDPRHFSNKSMRVGRTVSLQAQGASMEQITQELRWSAKSTSATHYMRTLPPGTHGSVNIRQLQTMQAGLLGLHSSTTS